MAGNGFRQATDRLGVGWARPPGGTWVGTWIELVAERVSAVGLLDRFHGWRGNAPCLRGTGMAAAHRAPTQASSSRLTYGQVSQGLRQKALPARSGTAAAGQGGPGSGIPAGFAGRAKAVWPT